MCAADCRRLDGVRSMNRAVRSNLGRSVRARHVRSDLGPRSVTAMAAMTLLLINLYTSVGYTSLVYPAPHGPVNLTEHYLKHLMRQSTLLLYTDSCKHLIMTIYIRQHEINQSPIAYPNIRLTVYVSTAMRAIFIVTGRVLAK